MFKLATLQGLHIVFGNTMQGKPNTGSFTFFGFQNKYCFHRVGKEWDDEMALQKRYCCQAC